jgi:transposase
MAKALSVDLRQRVINAIRDGMSRRQAALRFGISASSAIRWAQRVEASGQLAPKKQGGDRKSKRIEAHADFILDAIARAPDLTLAELQARLNEERGSHFGIGTLWRFFDRRRITFKKRLRTLPNKSGAT